MVLSWIYTFKHLAYRHRPGCPGSDHMNPPPHTHTRQKSKVAKFETALNIQGRPGSRFHHPGDFIVLVGCDPSPNPGSSCHWLHTIKEKRMSKFQFWMCNLIFQLHIWGCNCISDLNMYRQDAMMYWLKGQATLDRFFTIKSDLEWLQCSAHLSKCGFVLFFTNIKDRPGSRLTWSKSCLYIIWASMLTNSTLNSLCKLKSRFFDRLWGLNKIVTFSENILEELPSKSHK